MQTIDHSHDDVAYLRIAAHAERKQAKTPLSLFSPPILDPEFQAIYQQVKALPPFVPLPGTDIREPSPTSPRLLQIGNGTYVVDSISSGSDSSVDVQARHSLEKLMSTPLGVSLMIALLHENHLKSEHIISVVLLLNDMADFAAVNPVYASYFTFPLPPSRVTISVSMPDKVRLSAVISTRPRTGLHVQSRSYWAPSNIGPYSQSISVPLLVSMTNIVRLVNLPSRTNWSYTRHNGTSSPTVNCSRSSIVVAKYFPSCEGRASRSCDRDRGCCGVYCG